MTITEEQLDELERKAAAAGSETPGWWRPGAVEKYHVFAQCDDGIAPPLGRVLLRMNVHFPHEQTMEHIAANSPDVTLRLVAIARAALALVSQPMLAKGDSATWGDVAQSYSEGPRLLRGLMRAVNGEPT